MRFLVGLVAVVALVIGYVALYAEDEPVKRCPHCGFKAVSAYQESVGGPTLLSCGNCGAHFRQSVDGPLVPG